MRRLLRYVCTSCNLVYNEQHREQDTNPSRGMCPRCSTINTPKVTREPDET